MEVPSPPASGATSVGSLFWRSNSGVPAPAAEESPPSAVKTGSLRAPGDLGVAQKSQDENETNNNNANDGNNNMVDQIHPLTARNRQRERYVVQESRRRKNRRRRPSKHISIHDNNNHVATATFCYRGLEILLIGRANTCWVLSARTRHVLQQLTPGNADRADTDDVTIVSLVAHAVSGQIAVALSDGSIVTYLPQESDPLLVNYGHVHWRRGPVVPARLWGSDDTAEKNVPILALSYAHKLVCAVGNQLAVLEVSSSSSAATPRSQNGQLVEEENREDDEAECLWMTGLPGHIELLQVSGDGHSIAVVVPNGGRRQDDEELASPSLGVDSAESDGVFTFARDFDADPSSISAATSAGLVYRPGPFLVHASRIQHISFRGLGHVTSSLSNSGLGNDLLLTVDQEGEVHIFGQIEWRLITTWTTPPQTSVDWIQGIAALTLGDLEPPNTNNGKKQQHSRNPSADGPPIDAGRAQHHHHHHHHHPHSPAGAWVSELTFQGPFPALRLSRLSYLKRSLTDTTPTLVEAMSTFLPPACLDAGPNLHRILSVAGIWSAWNPQKSNPSTGSDVDPENLAPASAGVGPSQGYFGRHDWCPPFELRLVAPQMTYDDANESIVAVLEIPLVHGGGELEIGPTLTRSLVSMDEMGPVTTTGGPKASRSLESGGRLVARVVGDCDIKLTWRQPGSLSLLPDTWYPEDAHPAQAGRILESAKRWVDESILPAPLALPSVSLEAKVNNGSSIRWISWWPDHNESPPILLAFLDTGSIVALEMVPAWSSLELPAAPNDEVGPSSASYGSSALTNATGADSRNFCVEEYEVSIVPDPEHGLGLRLESTTDGAPAIAGSFKRHPLTGDVLPTELSGMVTIGDELLRADDILLTDKSFDEIIQTVREAGARAGPGQPVRMKFRRTIRMAPPNDDIATSGSSTPRPESGDSVNSEERARRSMSTMMGVTPNDLHKYNLQRADSSDLPPMAAVGAAGEPQVIENMEASHLSTTESTSSWSGICGMFQEVMEPGFWKKKDDPAVESRVVLCTLPGAKSEQNASLLLWISGAQLHIAVLRLVDWKAEKAEVVVSHHSIGDACECPLQQLVLAEQLGSTASFMVVDRVGVTHLVVVRVGESGSALSVSSVETYPLFQSDLLKREESQFSFVLRSCSIEVVAIMNKQNPTKIQVWVSRPHPGCTLDENEEDETTSCAYYDYCSAEIDIQSTTLTDENCFLDFAFAQSGFLDASPALICYTRHGVTVFRRGGGGSYWLPSTEVLYNRIQGETTRSRTKVELPVEADPLDTFPHMLTALQSTYASSDESSFIRSDWHPDSLLSQVCLDEKGVSNALKHRVRYLYMWVCSEGHAITDDDLEGSLMVAPLPIVDEETDVDCEVKNNNAFGMMTTMAGTSPSTGSCVDDEEAKLLKDMQSMIYGHISGDPPSPVGTNDSPLVGLPAVLRLMDQTDLEIVWAVGDMLLEPPPFEKNDVMAQLFLFCRDLFDRLSHLKSKKKPLAKKKMAMPSMHVAVSPSMRNITAEAHLGVASAGCLAMLMSDSQTKVLEFCRQHGQKLDWDTARRLRIAFWLRSDSALAKVSEEIGQALFRENRDIMECALFFIVAGKIRTLRNLAATDASDSGRKFLKFITTHDFSSDRGRRAAEKNAFSLLRKNRYMVASAFFLLAQPPFLKSAIETLVTKLKDLDLAFLVARLMESSVVNNSNSIGGGGGILGGGGGYAGSGFVSQAPVEEESTFKSWSPNLEHNAKELIVERILPQLEHDKVLGAVQLMWMDKREEASWWLSGFVDASFGFDDSFSLINDISRRFYDAWQKTQGPKSGFSPANARSNLLIDFVSSPLLLKRLAVNDRSLHATCLVVSNALSMRGIELSSIRLLIQFKGLEKESYSRESATTQAATKTANDTNASSSIFDSFDPPSQAATTNKPNSIFDSFDPPVPPSKPASSIFDSFDAPAPQPNSNPTSSIFDSFDAPAAPTKPASNSIFDSFDPAPPKPKTEPAANSIFDSFEPAPQKSKAGNGSMESSIFDSFDAPQTAQPRPPVVEPDQPQTAEGGSETVEESKIELRINSKPTPPLWNEWRRKLLILATGRRLIREIASVVNQFQGDPTVRTISAFYHSHESLIPSHASEVLQVGCDADLVLGRVDQSMSELVTLTELCSREIFDSAHGLLGHSLQFHRTLFSVILFAVEQRHELVDWTIKSASADLVARCAAAGLALDSTAHQRKSRSHAASQHLRRLVARMSWQLEICLWLHRGGSLHLSPATIREATVAVRLGLVLASWNQTHECLDSMLRSEPDTMLDDDAGRIFWNSLHTSAILEHDENRNKSSSSGGWEFLVDCRRSEATRLLRERPTGCFIIRPHPNDHGVFTLSFKTNLKPPQTGSESQAEENQNQFEGSNQDSSNETARQEKAAKKDDIVQHAVIRLSDSGFRCGSFGPFASLMSLLETVSGSLPFDLRFDLPPSNRVIKEEGSQPSPNAVFFRKLALSHADSLASSPPSSSNSSHFATIKQTIEEANRPSDSASDGSDDKTAFARFLDVLVLHKLRRQICAIAMAQQDGGEAVRNNNQGAQQFDQVCKSLSNVLASDSEDSGYTIVARTLRPLLQWVQCVEVQTESVLTPCLDHIQRFETVDFEELADAIEIAPREGTSSSSDRGDKLLRRMIQRGSGVEFSTLRLFDGGESTMIVVFSKAEALQWLLSSESEQTEVDALQRLEKMEENRVVEAIDLSKLPLKQKMEPEEDGARYRIVDPWEVEALLTRDGETRTAALGRGRLLGFSIGLVALAPEPALRAIGGLPMLELWTSTKGGIVLTKALASVDAPWERASGGDLLSEGDEGEAQPYYNSIRQHLYRNLLYRQLHLPQRFIALVQVELLDLKNLTSPGGSLSLYVYALARLKREGSGAALSNKSRTLDTAVTQAVRLGKSSGPNAPASWGSVVRFRFPLPEDVCVEGSSYDCDREALFKGPPNSLNVNVYEKKLLVDHSLGSADVRMDGLAGGGQLEEWVPLRSEKNGNSITWFARIRLTLRFELMCLADAGSSNSSPEEIPSVGLQKIASLSRMGGTAQEESKRSASSPDLLGYFESMMY